MMLPRLLDTLTRLRELVSAATFPVSLDMLPFAGELAASVARSEYLRGAGADCLILIHSEHLGPDTGQSVDVVRTLILRTSR